jgi:hypothetical protein
MPDKPLACGESAHGTDSINMLPGSLAGISPLAHPIDTGSTNKKASESYTLLDGHSLRWASPMTPSSKNLQIFVALTASTIRSMELIVTLRFSTMHIALPALA